MKFLRASTGIILSEKIASNRMLEGLGSLEAISHLINGFRQGTASQLRKGTFSVISDFWSPVDSIGVLKPDPSGARDLLFGSELGTAGPLGVVVSL
jgi:hypothetical protein